MRASTTAPLCSLQSFGTPPAAPVELYDPGLPAIEEPAFPLPRAMLSIVQLEERIKASVTKYLANVAHRGDRIIDSLGKVNVMTHSECVNVTVKYGDRFGFNLYDDDEELVDATEERIALKGFIKRMLQACGCDVFGNWPGQWAKCCTLDFDFYGMRTASKVMCVLLANERLASLSPLAPVSPVSELTSIDGFCILASSVPRAPARACASFDC